MLRIATIAFAPDLAIIPTHETGDHADKFRDPTLGSGVRGGRSIRRSFGIGNEQQFYSVVGGAEDAVSKLAKRLGGLGYEIVGTAADVQQAIALTGSSTRRSC